MTELAEIAAVCHQYLDGQITADEGMNRIVAIQYEYLMELEAKKLDRSNKINE